MSRVRSRSLAEDVQLLRVASRGMRVDAAFVPRVLEACAGAGIAPELVFASELAVSLIVPGEAALDRLGRALDEEAELTTLEDQAILCVVGSGLDRRSELRRRVLVELASWSPELVAMGSSRTSVIAVVEHAVLEQALGEIHRRFFEGSEVV